MHKEIVHADSDESDELSIIHEHERTLIQLVMDTSKSCQITTRFHHALDAFRRAYTVVSNFNTYSRVIYNLSRNPCGISAYTSRLVRIVLSQAKTSRSDYL